MLSRGLALAAGCSAFGALLFDVLAPDDGASRRQRRRLILGSLALAALCGVIGRDPAWPALGGLAASFVLLLGPAPAGPRLWLAAGCAALAVAWPPGPEPGGSALLAAAILHRLAAGAWLGGLLPQLLLAGAPAAATAARRFFGVSLLCAAVLAATGAVEGWFTIGSLPALIGTAYGGLATAKTALLLALLGLATAARDRATSRLLAIELALGLAAFAAAVALGAVPRASEAQPWWPFPWQLSLAAVDEDPDFRQEAILAVAALAGAVLLAAAALAFRRARWPAATLAAIVAWRALPHLGLLLAEAHPTSFYHSPTGFAAASITAGAALYGPHCARCHGAEGRGDGPDAAGLPVPPADLTATHLWGHSDGELFWWLGHGIEAPEGGLAMPGFAAMLSETERWALIDYIRARNAGMANGGGAAWPVPVHAPAFAAACPDGKTPLAALRGAVVRLWFSGPGLAEPPPTPVAAGVRVVEIRVGPGPAGGCMVDDPAVTAAYAIVAGSRPEALAGTEFLIDPEGWLRAVRRPGAPAIGEPPQGWQDPAALLAAIRQICTHPVITQGSGHGEHAQEAD